MNLGQQSGAWSYMGPFWKAALPDLCVSMVFACYAALPPT